MATSVKRQRFTYAGRRLNAKKTGYSYMWAVANSDGESMDLLSFKKPLVTPTPSVGAEYMFSIRVEDGSTTVLGDNKVYCGMRERDLFLDTWQEEDANAATLLAKARLEKQDQDRPTAFEEAADQLRDLYLTTRGRVKRSAFLARLIEHIQRP